MKIIGNTIDFAGDMILTKNDTAITVEDALNFTFHIRNGYMVGNYGNFWGKVKQAWIALKFIFLI